MSRLDDIFAAQKQRGKKVLAVYLCVGDPSVGASFALAMAAIGAGADVLELGVPFSDPTADGPAIARASERAIRAGSSLGKTIEVASRIRRESGKPIVLFGYYNPIFVRGERRVVDEAKEAGIDAMLVVDLPPEEGTRLRDAAEKVQIAMIPLITPTSGPERVKAAVARASGFLYYVSVTGVTGPAAERALSQASAQAGKLGRTTGMPVVVGFGIDSANKARIASAGADGVVVGTAVVKAIEAGGDDAARAANVRDLVGALRAALDGPGGS
jgi:tryptophan synthase alpha chain